MTRKQRLRQEAAAWRECAEWVRKNRSTVEGIGLCHLLDSWGRHQTPTHWPHGLMRDRLREHTTYADTGAYLDYISAWSDDSGRNTQTRHARVIFCLLMAHECEEEARA